MSESNKIKGQERSYDYGYKNFDFRALRYGSHNSESLINYDGFTLKDYISNEVYTGLELLYYPELTKAMRESIKEYPLMTRKYEADTDISGLAFLITWAQD